MKPRRRTWLVSCTALLAVAGAFVSAAAETPAPDVPTELIAPVRATVQETGGIKYLNGGAGEEERTSMLTMGAQFPLHLVFSMPTGAYTVADELAILADNGPMLNLTKAGPWLMVRLPPGRYTLRARFNGAVQQRTVQLGTDVLRVHWISGVA